MPSSQSAKCFYFNEVAVKNKFRNYKLRSAAEEQFHYFNLMQFHSCLRKVYALVYASAGNETGNFFSSSVFLRTSR